MFTTVFAVALSAFAVWQLSLVMQGDEPKSKSRKQNFQEFFITGRYWWTFLLPSLRVVEDDSKLGILRSV
jgi:hypothetical protein